MAQLRAAQMAKRQAAAAGTNPGTTSASQERLAEGETDDAENEVHMNTEVTGIEAAKPTESAPTVEETRKRKKGKKRKKTNQVSNGTQDLDRQEKKRMKKQKRQAGRAARAAENR